jgi:imidazolonepropionase-like amidohydrolase
MVDDQDGQGRGLSNSYAVVLRNHATQAFLSPDCRDKSVVVMKTGLEALKIANDAGVTICYGSDLLISMQALQTGGSSVMLWC